jgi:hypothetical protein
MGPRPAEGPLQAEVVCAATLSLRMHADDLDHMERVITWRRTPDFPVIGRSAWIKLTHPFEAQCGQGTQVIRSLKLKGVGLRDHRGNTQIPSNVAYRRPDTHLGIDEHGVFCVLRSALAPMGALALDRAVVEYTTSRELSATGPISEVPLFIYRYSTLDGFRDDSGSMSDLAVLVAGLPIDTPVRADHLVHCARQDPAVQAAVRNWARTHTGDSEFDWARAQLVLWREYGKRLREFHGCGFYRHNAHSSNLGLGSHGVFLVDLDSTRHMLECPPRIRALQAVRDAVGGVIHLIADTIRSGELGSAESASAMHGTLIDAFLKSYLPDIPNRAFEDLKVAAGSVTSELWERWAEGTFVATGLEHSAAIKYQEFMTDQYSHISQGIDVPTLFCSLMPGLAEPYSLSRVAYQGSLVCPSEVSKAAKEFLSLRHQPAPPR